jgi:hypothetical protein
MLRRTTPRGNEPHATGSLDRLTALLLERETVDGADVDQVLGRVPPAPATVGVDGHWATRI